MKEQDRRERLDWRVGLKAGDPLHDDSVLSADNARVMRRVVVAAASELPVVVLDWPRPLAIATTIALTLALGIVIGQRLPKREVVPTKLPTVERRQIQFETPGGTRIIWTFSSDFDL